MVTASNAVKAAIEDNWNAGTGGTEPTVYTSAEETMWPKAEEWIYLKTWEYGKKRKRRNDSFVKEDDYVGLRVYTRNHANKEERLDEMVTEVYRIVTTTNVAGYHKVDIIDQHRRASDRRLNEYAADLLVELKILSTAATAVPGSVASTATIDALLMYGAANAAWVPMTFEATYASTVQVRGESSQIANVDGLSDGYWMFNLAQPPVKGSLKLYISGLRVVVLDADADDYVTHVFLTGVGDTNNLILNDPTDRTSPDTYDYTFAAEDMSAAHTVRALVQTVNTDVTDLNIGAVSCRCYYA